jgi:hypothetical protein
VESRKLREKAMGSFVFHLPLARSTALMFSS